MRESRAAQRGKLEFVPAALEFVDENGIDALTLRALGDQMGVHFTAVYRYYPSKEALIAAMADYVVAQAMRSVPLNDLDPAEQLVELGCALRAAMSQHPALAVAVMSTEGRVASVLELGRQVVTSLERMGLSGRRLVVAYQMLESHVMGTTAFDYSRAPSHLTIRNVRHHELRHSAFDDELTSDQAVAAVNEDAFRAGLRALIDSLV